MDAMPRQNFQVMSPSELNELGMRYHQIKEETGRGLSHDREGKIVDSRTEEQIEIVNKIATSMFPVLKKMAFSLKTTGRYNPFKVKEFPSLLGLDPKKSTITIEDLVGEGVIAMSLDFDKCAPKEGRNYSVYSFVVYRAAERMIFHIAKDIPNGLRVLNRIRRKKTDEIEIGGVKMKGIPMVNQISLDQIMYDENGERKITALEINYLVSRELSPFEERSIHEAQELISEALSRLSERERHVIESKYGIPDGEEVTLEKLGQRYRVSKERIRQIQNRAEEKLEKIVKGMNEFYKKE